MTRPRCALRDPHSEDLLRRDGYVVLPLLTEGDLAALRAVYDRVAQAHDDGFMASVLHGDLAMRAGVHSALAEIWRARVLPVLEEFRIIVGSVAAKAANSDSSSVGLHQDLSFVDENRPGHLALSIWAPLQDVTPENGCLSLAPGSHLLNSNWREPSGLPYRELIPVIEGEFMQALPMRAGEVLLMDSRTFHGSPPNFSDRPRVVAAGVAIPAESPLFYVHRDHGDNPDQVEVWQVPEDFYRQHTIGMRPAEGRHLATLAGDPEPLDEARLRRALRPVAAHA
ncbi:phytanoyl-CoA dioxygenase family protein [Marinovum sp. SP66]|uniref:phytanoyl-CoA dioxygenase family protein n=1 Tax=Marinovum TaxID=367771 RepID=UPI00237BC5E1|nr:phytanoyl-CoA dioxygenase family protein [Marinovum sp. SP66]MDD9742202.1 phytanoyl-CoA dioxygenase family protein [Marinovum sp. SP66]